MDRLFGGGHDAGFFASELVAVAIGTMNDGFSPTFGEAVNLGE